MNAGWIRFALASLLLGAVSGCGSDGLRRVPVEGKVTAKGTAVGGATVLFMPLGDTLGEGAIGTTDAEGHYTLIGSRQGDSGIVPGRYKVRVSRLMDRDGSILSIEAKQADYPHSEESIPAPYSSAEPPVEVTVPEKGGTINVIIPVATLDKK
jgi:hypothetical protein